MMLKIAALSALVLLHVTCFSTVNAKPSPDLDPENPFKLLEFVSKIKAVTQDRERRAAGDDEVLWEHHDAGLKCYDNTRRTSVRDCDTHNGFSIYGCYKVSDG